MLYGFQMALQYHIQVDESQCDNKNIVDTVKGKERPGIYMDTIAADIADIAKKVGCTSFTHKGRLANMAAHHIAHGKDFISIRHCPTHVKSYIANDVRTD